MDVAKITWTGGLQLVGVDEGGHSVVMDAPREYGGDGSGIRPVELVLHALAACSAMDVVSILQKKRQDFRSLEVLVEADQRTDEYPKIYTRISLEYVVSGYGVSESAVARAIELSEEKYCSVRGMLGEGTDVVTSFRIIEERLPGTPAQAE